MTAIAFIGVFMGVGLTDYLWARYILALSDHRALAAAMLSGVLQGVSSVVTLAYVDQHWLIIAATGGAFTGTLVALRKEL